MDLVERRAGAFRRHPWETARIDAVKKILGRLSLREPRVLELGCGDAYVLGELRRTLAFREALAYDLYLTEELIGELRPVHPDIRFVGRQEELRGTEVDLVLLLDVLEHIEDPATYLRQVVRDRLARNGWLVVTVPAFQVLFSEHDRRLRHFRRYSREAIAQVVAAAGFEVVDSGYLFASLIPLRALELLKERLSPARTEVDASGIGGWKGSNTLTGVLHRALCWDNQLCLAAHDLGFDVPGLSAWLTCRRSS